MMLLDRPDPRVVIMVGTGVSRSETNDPCATWQGLLLDGLKRLEAAGRMDAEEANAQRVIINKAFGDPFDIKEVLQRAESITRAFGGVSSPEYGEWLASTVGALRLRKRKKARSEVAPRLLIDSIAELGHAGALLVTTNYDSLLEQATGFDPITWQEPDEILQLMNHRRKKGGILHLHGHWSKPSSVILSGSTYEDIVRAEVLQTQFKSLWMSWSWLYLGCGSGGLDDPNLGALLRWARDAGFGPGEAPDFFLSDKETVAKLPEMLSRESFVRHGYKNHGALPGIVEHLIPAERSAPFVRQSETIRVRRDNFSPIVAPFPTWQEYRSAEVPPLSADKAVLTKLNDEGFAIVVDGPSVGKSTLACRIAATGAFSRAYCLELGNLHLEGVPEHLSPAAALGRLARPGVLLVLDDAHLQPNLTLQLWRQWRERPNGSKLLVIATRTANRASLTERASADALAAEMESEAIALHCSASDMGHIANCVLKRLGSPAREIPEPDLASWHKRYSRELGAFVMAVSQLHKSVAAGQFELPASAASTWIRERHLSKLSAAELDNVMCLAAFGALEIEIPEDCLPHPALADHLLRTGLVAVTRADDRPDTLALLEPGWGALIEAALHSEKARLELITSAASKSFILARAAALQLRVAGPEWTTPYFRAVLNQLSTDEHIGRASLQDISALIAAAQSVGEHASTDRLLKALTNLETLRRCLGECTSLAGVCNVLQNVKHIGDQDILSRIWRTLSTHPDLVTRHLPAAPVKAIADFQTAAKDFTVSDAVWSSIRNQHQVHLRKATGDLNAIVELAGLLERQGQTELRQTFMRSLNKQPYLLTAGAIGRSLNVIGPFFQFVGRNGAAAKALSEALLAEIDHLEDLATSVSVETFATFLRASREAGQHTLVDTLSDRLAGGPATRLVSNALAESMQSLLTLFNAAGSTPLGVSLWHVLTPLIPGQEFRSLLEKSPISVLAPFLRCAEKYAPEEARTLLWDEVERATSFLIPRCVTRPISSTVALTRAAKSAQRPEFASKIWEGLEDHVPELAEVGCAEKGFNSLISFLLNAPEQLERNLAQALSAEMLLNGRAILHEGAHLAQVLRDAGRDDLAKVLAEALLKRRDPRDFAGTSSISQLGNLFELCDQPRRVAALMGVACNEGQLSSSYSYDTVHGIAYALYTIAIHCPRRSISKIWHPALRKRIDDELRSRDDQIFLSAVRLTGAAALCGVRIQPRSLNGIGETRLRQAPSLLKPVTTAAEARDDRRFWLGMRAIVSELHEAMPMDRAALVNGLTAWRKELGETPRIADIRASMVRWLEDAMVSGVISPAPLLSEVIGLTDQFRWTPASVRQVRQTPPRPKKPAA